MFQKILVMLGVEIFKAIWDGILEYAKTISDNQRIKKEVKEKVNEILNERDPVIRAKRMRDLLNS